ncbi:AraC family transcriptional regulator [Dinghuibacter silviterrae]|uniref:AraC family transcriptional regulator n=2 Tax=Dinghuibacter silviterrae TaxID=1539049 RepID=A0A4R8DE88_9BACT|nr:AraC family transcriptional regulator [Dinghuibacter silviterrae]
MEEFPDITWLKGQIDRRFENRLGWGNCVLDTEGFPSVIIHTKTRECYRPDVKGPFSFFLNIRGSSICSVDRRASRIDTDSYFVSNNAQQYTLQVEKGSDTETFNIHFGEFFAASVLNALVTPADRILENGRDAELSPVLFFNQLHRRDVVFNELVNRLMRGGIDRLFFEEQLSALLEYHLQQHRHIASRVNKLPPVKVAIRVELYKRLSRAMDAIHAGFDKVLSLDVLAVEASLSKYHFLRLFRQAYGVSPHQYMQQLRMEKAKVLLSRTQIPVADLAGLLGYKDGPSFSRLFFQRMGIYPTQYRASSK